MVRLAPATRGRLLHATELSLRIGGTESNVAIGVARLGVSAGWISRLDAGELGQLVLSRVRAEGVDTSAVLRGPEPTGLYLIDELPTGVRAHYYRAGSAASKLDAGSFDPAYLEGANFLHLTAVTPALSASCATFVRWAASEARKRKVRVSFDANFRSALWSAKEAAAFIESFLPFLDVLFVSEDDALAVWGKSASETLHHVGASAHETIVTRAALGSIASIGGAIIETPGVPVAALDLVGCGDAFAAGYLAASVWGENPQRRLAIANVMGAYNALALGDYEGLPARAELERFMSGKRGGMTR